MPLFDPHINGLSAGTTSVGNGTLVFSNSNSVSFGVNGSTITASFDPAETQYVFSNSNGVSFGTNASTVTATVKTDYQSSGNYLTTAAQSNQVVNSINGSTGIFTFNTGSSLSSSRNANSITFGLASDITTALQSTGAYLTTAAQSNQVVNSVNGSTGIFTFGTGSSLSSSRNGNSITWGLASDISTALQSAGAYLTTARRSTDAVGLNTAKTNVTWTVNSSGISLDAGGYAGTNTATTGAISVTLNTSGISLNIGAYLTTADLSANSSKYVQNWKLTGNTAGTTSSAQGTDLWFSGGNSITVSGNSNSIVFSVGAYITTQTNQNISLYALGNTTQNSSTLLNASNLSFNGLGGITVGYSAGSIQLSAGASAGVGGISNSETMYTSGTIKLSQGGGAITIASTTGQVFQFSVPQTSSLSATGIVSISVNGSTISIGAPIASIKVSGGTSSVSLSDITFSNSNGVSFGLNGSTMTASVNSYTASLYEPFWLLDGSSTTTGSLSQLHLQPFTIQNNLSFGNVNIVGIAAVVPTSASQSWSVRLTNSTQGMSYVASYSITNGNLVDLFLFSRGSGKFSSELETFASTRNSFLTYYNVTFGANATLTNAAGGSIKGSQTISMSISYPFMTSGQVIVGASTDTTWGSGYTTWTSTASNSSEFTISSSAGRTLSIASTYPATVGWSGAKLINLNFGTSLTPGEYWLGVIRFSTSSSSSSSAQSFTGAAGTGNSYSVTFNASALTQTAELSWAGKTGSIANNIGSLGFITTNNVAPQFGLGSFSAAWASNVTNVNNAGNPAGAVAFTQLRTEVSFFNTWFQLASNRI